MFDYLQKFNSLPKDLRDRVSSPSVMAAVTELENRYKIDLAMTVMKIMIKSLTIKDLPLYFISESGLTPLLAENLTRELKEKVFSAAAEYLGLVAEIRAFDLDRDINLLIKEAGLVLPSANLVSRLKNILAIYSRGVRSKIDTRNSLAKDVKIGGLNLSSAEIDRVLKICDGQKIKVSETDRGPVTPAVSIKAPLAFSIPPEEYDLKRALASGQVKTVSPKIKIEDKPPVTERPIDYKLDLDHEISAPEKQLDLIAPEKQLDLPRAEKAIKAPVETIKEPIVKPVIPIKSLIHPVEHPVIHQEVPPIVHAPIVHAPAAKLSPLVPPIPPVSPLAPLKPPVAPLKSAITSQTVKVPKKPGFFSNLFKSHKKETAAVVQSPSPVKPLAAPVKPSAPSVKQPAIPVKNIIPSAPRPIADRRPAPAPSSARPQMHDVKPMPKVMGPIEELQFLDPLNFRRLGKMPDEATAKIFAKIKLLEKEGYDKMVAGVRAWRQSPTNRLYLHLGQEAIINGVFLKEAVAARQKAGQECLSMEEIEAIVNLNSKLVF